MGEIPAEAELPSELEPEIAAITEPEAVIATRVVIKMGKKMTEWLVHWKSKPIEEATWENAIDIQSQFPAFCLEDKAVFAEGSVDKSQTQSWAQEGLAHVKTRPKLLQVYSRRTKKVAGEG